MSDDRVSIGSLAPSDCSSQGATITASKIESIESILEKNMPEKNMKIVFAGKSGAGKSTLINKILDREEDIELSLKSMTQKLTTGKLEKNDITIYIVDTPGLKGDMAKQLKELSKHTNNDADLLVYCLPINPGAKLTEDKDIMQALQDVYSSDIWKHCVLVLTFSNSALNHFKRRLLTIPDQSNDKYINYVNDCVVQFKKLLTSMEVEDIDAKSIFEEADQESTATTIIAIPAGLEDRDKVLLQIESEEGWKGKIFLEMLKKCEDKHKAALLQYKYGRNRTLKALQRHGATLVGASGGGAATVVGASMGGILGVAGGPAGVVVGGLLGAAAGIVAGAIFSGGVAGMKKFGMKDK